MKKNIVKVAFMATFALLAGYGVYTAQTETNLSDLALDNVSALASGETSGAKCYGPKSSSECQCTNSTPCRDNSGCN